MIKILGQTGLNKIANKYKELKKLVDKKVDGVDGKQLSTNDYDNQAKTKVDAIPTNPKYTDTITSVVDNLTTDDGTKALSAKQGKALQDGKADKSNISRCKAKGYSSASSWSSASTERDLEDWIGDFDKRTRELKSGGGGTIKECFFKQNSKSVATKIGKMVVMYVDGQDFANSGGRVMLPTDFRPASIYFLNASQLSTGEKEIAFNCGAGTFVSILSDGTVRLMVYGASARKTDAFASNIVYFTD